MKFDEFKYRGILVIGAIVSSIIFGVFGFIEIASSIIMTYSALRLGWYMGEK